MPESDHTEHLLVAKLRKYKHFIPELSNRGGCRWTNRWTHSPD